MKRYTQWLLYLIFCPHQISREKNYLPLKKNNWDQNSNLYRVVHEKIYYLYIYILNQFIPAQQMMEFTQYDWSQHDIINKIVILTKQGTYTILTVILKKYQKYPSTAILKCVNVLAKENKSPYTNCINMIQHEYYSTTIHVSSKKILDMRHKKRIKILLSNKQYIK